MRAVLLAVLSVVTGLGNASCEAPVQAASVRTAMKEDFVNGIVHGWHRACSSGEPRGLASPQSQSQPPLAMKEVSNE
jgi:hypothetical protein